MSCCSHKCVQIAPRTRCSVANGSVGYFGITIVRPHSSVEEDVEGIRTAGLYLIACVSALIALFKLMGVNDWSWWRVCLPLGSYVGFNLTYIATGFAYLSWMDFVNGRGSTEKARIADDDQKWGYYWLSWIHFTLFAVGISEWASPSQAWNGFWRSFGSAGVMITFASLTIVSLILFWSNIIECLSESNSTR
jgi:hypothetical protein